MVLHNIVPLRKLLAGLKSGLQCKYLGVDIYFLSVGIATT